LLIAAILCLTTPPAFSQNLKGAVKGALGTAAGGSGAGDGDVAAGLKEALAVGTGNAVQTLSKSNGYFGECGREDPAAAETADGRRCAQEGRLSERGGRFDPEHEPGGRAGGAQGPAYF
jgi:hypothetical protein